MTVKFRAAIKAAVAFWIHGETTWSPTVVRFAA